MATLTAAQTKNKLMGTNVKGKKIAMSYVVDKAKNEPLYDSINDDEAILPSSTIIILIDGENKKAALGDGTAVFSESVQLGVSVAPAE